MLRPKSDLSSTLNTTFSQCLGGKVAHKWQLDAAESLFLGLDTIVLAGTGTGKTIAYMLPLLLSETKNKVLFVIEPLMALQRDQMHRFRRMGLSALAVNAQTWHSQTAKEVKEMKYRVVFHRSGDVS